LLSAAPAHAHRAFELTEAAAHAGDLVHFSISASEGPVTYELEVGDKEVLQGTGVAAVSGTFTVPDLGDAARTVTVEAEVRGSEKKKKLKRKLDYLGPALPVTRPPAPAPPPAAVVVPQAAPSPEPIHSPKAMQGAPPQPASTPQSGRRPRQSRKRRGTAPPPQVSRGSERRRGVHRRRDRSNRDAAARKTRSKHPAPRTAPLFDGIPEPGARPGANDGFFSLNAIAPPPAVLAATSARSGSGSSLAIVVPALLGLAALTLAATAALRRRRLASRSRRN
jgi:hypothetical protein